MGSKTILTEGLCLLAILGLSQCLTLRRTIGWPEDPCGQTLNRVRHLPSMPNSPELPPNNTVPGNQVSPGHRYGLNSFAYMMMLENYDAPDIPDPSPLLAAYYMNGMAQGAPGGHMGQGFHGAPVGQGLPGGYMGQGAAGANRVPMARGASNQPGARRSPNNPRGSGFPGTPGVTPMMECRCERGCRLGGGIVVDKYAHQCVSGYSCCCMAK